MHKPICLYWMKICMFLYLIKKCNTTFFVHGIKELCVQEFQESILPPIMYNTFIGITHERFRLHNKGEKHDAWHNASFNVRVTSLDAL